MLDGFDTVGGKLHDLVNYVRGHVEDSVVKDAAELRDALGRFGTQPDRELRFPVNSMQCSDVTWKDALQHLLGAADVVVMDLSSLSQKNRGCAHEIGKLVDLLELQRIVFLIDTTTDMEVLDDILALSWENMAAASPNRHAASPRLRLYQTGGASRRGPHESLYDWRRRQSLRLDEKALVRLLFDAAQPARSVACIDPKRDAQSIRWARVPMPALVRRTRDLVFGSFFLLTLVISSCNVLQSG
jgi:hypothetical protein